MVNWKLVVIYSRHSGTQPVWNFSPKIIPQKCFESIIGNHKLSLEAFGSSW
jgi:hypothetical protein